MRAALTSVWLVFFVLAGNPVAKSANDVATCRDQKGEIAIAACTRALSSDGLGVDQRVLVYEMRGMALHKNGEHDRAIADFSAAIRIEPKSGALFIGRGFAYADKGDLDRALADHIEAVRLNPRDANGLFARGYTYMRKGDTDRAIGDFSEVLRLKPQDHTVRSLRGLSFSKNKEYDRAIADFNLLVRANPKDAWYYIHRGQAFRGKKDLDRAIADYSEAIRLDPTISQAYGLRAAIFYLKGDHDRAVTDLTEAVRLDPNNQVTSSALSKIRQRNVAKSSIVWPDPPGLAARPSSAQSGSVAGPVAKPVLASGRRVALVIGNGRYQSMPQLPNPPNDAADIAQVLNKLGFKVTLAVDAKRADMEEALAAFAREARQADTALVFYAGHGLQHQGVNYLAPVDARLTDETDLRKFVRVQSVLEDLQNVNGVRILILDACRDNEAIRQLAAVLPKTRSAGLRRGLAGEKADGVIIAYATQPDRVAADGDGRNSPFTAALLKNLPTPGVELRTMFTRVRAEVLRTTGRTQRPETSDSLDGEVVLSTP